MIRNTLKYKQFERDESKRIENNDTISFCS